MNKSRILGLLTILASTVALAQPPEEVPPPLPETTEQVAPSTATPPTFAPVAEPKLAAPVAPPEDHRMKGVQITPSIGVYPFGYDSFQSVSGAEGGRYFLGIKPGINMDTSFKTATDKTIDLSVGFTSQWREYYNKAGARRDFDNDLTGAISMKLNDLISVSIPGEFEYFFKAGADTANDNNIFINLKPMVSFAVNKSLTLRTGYELQFVDLLTAPVGPNGQNLLTDPPSDVDDARRGSLTSDATGFNNFNPSSFDTLGGSSAITPVTSTQDLSWADNRAVFGVNYEVIPGTKIDFEYRYVFAQISNSDDTDLTAHYLVPSISQSLPWKGGTIGVKDEFRMRKYDYATVAGSNDPRQNFRSRFTITAGQEINDYMDFEFWYRWQATGENADNYANITNNNAVYMGINFKF